MAIDLRALARDGAGLRMESLESELEALRAEFPDLAVARDRARRPTPAADEPERAAPGARTPPRRRSPRPRTRSASRTNGSGAGHPAGWKHRWYARLQEHGPESLKASSKALKTASATLLTSGRRWLEAGVYGVGKVAPTP